MYLYPYFMRTLIHISKTRISLSVSMKRHILTILSCTLLLLPAIGQKSNAYKVGRNIDLFNQVYKTLDEYYVDTLNADKIIPDAIQYMLEGLDPYTEYISAEDALSIQTLTTGKYAGIGAVIRYYKDKDRCIIYEPYENMPAAKAGLQSGDVIIAIDGKDVGKKGNTATDKYVSTISNLLRGDPETTLTVQIERPGTSQPLTFEVHRANISMQAVPYTTMIAGNIGFIKLTTFTKGCSDMVLTALKDLKSQGAKSLILDLRDNGGGLAIEAVNLVNLFVPKNKLILSMKGKYKSSNVKYFTSNIPEDLHIPLVVLVNGQSASSSEITCGALQDLDRAVILGERTFGKGLVQQPHELPYGAVLKLTTSHYYIPSGRCIQALDYSRRSVTGEAYRTPDSLTKVFRTAGGREVRDGGGISPDIVSKPDSLPNLIYYLQASDQLQEYCNQYRSTHLSISPPDKFSLSDNDFEEFKKFLLGSDFSYDRQTFKALQELRKIAEREGYEKSARPEFDALEKKLSHDLSYDLDLWKKEIIQQLNAELCLRYHFRKGYYASLIPHDPVVQAAAKILQTPEKYNNTLKK